MESNTTSCTSSFSSTSTIKKGDKTSGSSTIKRHNHYQNRHFRCLHLRPEIYDGLHLYSHRCQTCRNGCPIGLWSHRKLLKFNLHPMVKNTNQTTSKTTNSPQCRWNREPI